jgi:hypothetical protein
MFGWSGYGSQLDAANPEMVAVKRHDQVNVLDLDMTLQRKRTRMGTTVTFRVTFRPYSKPGNSQAFHGRHTFRGWVLAELLRLVTHSSTPELWKEAREGSMFYHHWHPSPASLFQRIIMIPTKFPQSSVSRGHMDTEVWATQGKSPEERQRVFRDLVVPSMCTHTPSPHRTCVAAWPRLRELLDLSLNELTESTVRVGDIFQPRVSWPSPARHDSDRFFKLNLNVNESSRGGCVRQPRPRG